MSFLTFESESHSVVSYSLRPHGYWTRILEWVAFPFSRGSSQPRDRTQVSRIAGGFFTSWATRKSMGSAREAVTFRKRLPSTDYCLMLLFPRSFTGRFKGRVEFGAATSIGGFPWWPSGEELTCQCRRRWFRKIPWRRKWQPTLVFLSGKSHGQKSLAGYSPWGRKSPTEWLSTQVGFRQ